MSAEAQERRSVEAGAPEMAVPHIPADPNWRMRAESPVALCGVRLIGIPAPPDDKPCPMCLAMWDEILEGLA